MTQSYNLSQLANNLNSAGQLDATDGLVGAVPAANGGTGQSAYTVGDILYASGATALAKLSDVATGNALISGGVAASPSWGKIGLSTHVSGTLPIASGGTNSTATPTAGGIIYGTGTAYAVTSAGTSGQVLTSAAGGAPTWNAIQAGQNNATVFATAGTGQTFTIPAGVSRVKITVIGGGGNGGAGSTGGGGSTEYYGGGGGGGGTAIKWLAVSNGGGGGTLTVAVGGATVGSSVSSGTSNTITTITAGAGSNGGDGPNGNAGSGGVGANGDLNITGGTGTKGSNTQSMGGGTFMAQTSFGAGNRYGGGGGGGLASGSSGGAGATGVVIFEY